MSYSSDALKMDRMVRDIYTVDGLIAEEAQGSDRPVYPKRDKRKRPVIWLERAGFSWLHGRGMIEREPRGYVLAGSVLRRLKYGAEDAVRQHQDRVEREIYTPDGALRPANVNTRLSALDRLARMKGGVDGGRCLSAAEVEAGRALARDYHRAGAGHIAGQDFTTAGVQGGDRHGAAERAMLNRITASTRLRAAREILGPDFAPGVIALCCRSESVEDVERTERWAAGSGKQLIKMGLARLVTLYGTESGMRPRSEKT